jgi:hypothetical protein
MSDQKKGLVDGKTEPFERKGEMFSRQRFDFHDPFKSLGKSPHDDFDNMMFQAKGPGPR